MGRPKKRRQSELDFSEGADRADFWPESHDAPLPGPTSQLATPPHNHNHVFSSDVGATFSTLHDLVTPFDLDAPDFSLAPAQLDPLPDFPLDPEFLNQPSLEQLNSAGPKLKKESVHRIFQVIARFLFTQQISCDGIPNPELAAAAGPDISDAQKLSARQASHPNVTCPCLSSVYLALDSLNNISADIPAAICTARATAKIAHEVLRCTTCGTPLLEVPLATPSMQSLQNTMLLSTLLASLSNAYSRLLDTIDIAAAEARDAGTMLRFSFRPLGGVWSDLGSDSSGGGGGGGGSGGGECLLSLVINESDLNPDVWRLAMRAVLRYEIYGFNLDPPPPSLCAADELTVPEHLGLAQAVRDLEERARLRHEKVDHLIAAGHDLGCVSLMPIASLPKGQKPPCMQVIECARLALDKLSIT